MIALPNDITAINDFALRIEIQFLQKREERKRLFPRLISKKLYLQYVLESPDDYIAVSRYQKQIQLSSYNQENVPVLKMSPAAAGSEEAKMVESVRIITQIVPYSNYNLLNKNLRKVIEQHQNWRLGQPVDFGIIKACVLFKSEDIGNYVQELLDILLSMLVNMRREDTGFNDILSSTLELFRKLEQFPSNEGHRII